MVYNEFRPPNLSPDDASETSRTTAKIEYTPNFSVIGSPIVTGKPKKASGNFRKDEQQTDANDDSSWEDPHLTGKRKAAAKKTPKTRKKPKTSSGDKPKSARARRG